MESWLGPHPVSLQTAAAELHTGLRLRAVHCVQTVAAFSLLVLLGTPPLGEAFRPQLVIVVGLRSTCVVVQLLVIFLLLLS